MIHPVKLESTNRSIHLMLCLLIAHSSRYIHHTAVHTLRRAVGIVG